jgi:nucleoid DNA-binding protein
VTKRELIEKLAHAEGITLKVAENPVNTSFETMTETLARSGRRRISLSIGGFRVRCN